MAQTVAKFMVVIKSLIPGTHGSNKAKESKVKIIRNKDPFARFFCYFVPLSPTATQPQVAKRERESDEYLIEASAREGERKTREREIA